MLAITLMLKFVSLAIVVIMWNRPDIFPFFSWISKANSFINTGVTAEFYDIYKIIFTVIILLTVVGVIEDLYNIIKLENYKVKY